MKLPWRVGDVLAVSFLLVVHILTLAAPWFATHHPAIQNRDFPFAPPTVPRVVDSEGNWRSPFLYRLTEDPENYGSYLWDQKEQYPLRLGIEQVDPARGIVEWRPVGVDEPGFFAALGTDRFGRDLFSRWLHGGRYSLAVGWGAGLLSLFLGCLLGGLAGFYGGWLDQGVMRAVDLLLALPWLYLLFAVRAFLPLDMEPSETVWMLIVLLTVLGWAVPARLIRGVVIESRERPALRIARSFGASDIYLLRRHILPGLVGVVTTQGMLRIPRCILAEAALSFFGLGIAEPTPSWGNLLSELQNFTVLTEACWMSFPAIVLILVILSYHRLANSMKGWFWNGTGGPTKPV